MWKDIKNYEGLYQVNELGEVKGLVNNKILKPTKHSEGYLQVRLSKNNIKKAHYIHRLVAQAFIDNKENYPCVNHKDENKTNNCVSNLEWCDHKYNDNYGTRNQRMGNSKSIKVYQFDLQGNLLNSFRNYNGFIWSYDNSIDF